MGGFGSGRYGGKKKVDHCRKLDINKMLQAGCLRPGNQGGWQWFGNDEPIAEIGYIADENLLTLRYKFKDYGNDWESVKQPTPIIWMQCRYGGKRPYFRCPGIVNGIQCGRRSIKLYMGGKYFLCRHCYNLSYKSQSETRHDRLMRRANKRRIALGGEPGIYALINKPKGMWQRTYDRHRAEIISVENKSTAEFVRMFSGRLSSEELEMWLE